MAFVRVLSSLVKDKDIITAVPIVPDEARTLEWRDVPSVRYLLPVDRSVPHDREQIMYYKGKKGVILEEGIMKPVRCPPGWLWPLPTAPVHDP